MNANDFADQYLGSWTVTAVFTTEEVVRLYKDGHIPEFLIEPLMELSYDFQGRLNHFRQDNHDITMQEIQRLKRLSQGE